MSKWETVATVTDRLEFRSAGSSEDRSLGCSTFINRIMSMLTHVVGAKWMEVCFNCKNNIQFA